MRTIEEHIVDACKYYQVEMPHFTISMFPYHVVQKAINEARKEAIEECIKISFDYCHSEGNRGDPSFILEESFLSLINELK